MYRMIPHPLGISFIFLSLISLILKFIKSTLAESNEILLTKVKLQILKRKAGAYNNRLPSKQGYFRIFIFTANICEQYLLCFWGDGFLCQERRP